MKKLLIAILLIPGFVTQLPAQVQEKPCIFCRIATEKIQEGQVVYRDETVVAFLSHGPDNPGHMLVVPVDHAAGFTDIPEATVCNMMHVARLVIDAIRRTDIQNEAFRIMMNAGAAAGQSVMHAHLHVIPRYKGETLNVAHTIAPAEELDAVAEKIRNAMKQSSITR